MSRKIWPYLSKKRKQAPKYPIDASTQCLQRTGHPPVGYFKKGNSGSSWDSAINNFHTRVLTLSTSCHIFPRDLDWGGVSEDHSLQSHRKMAATITCFSLALSICKLPVGLQSLSTVGGSEGQQMHKNNHCHPLRPFTSTPLSKPTHIAKSSNNSSLPLILTSKTPIVVFEDLPKLPASPRLYSLPATAALVPPWLQVTLSLIHWLFSQNGGVSIAEKNSPSTFSPKVSLLCKAEAA